MKAPMVGVILKNSNGEILLLERTKKPFGLGIPGGKLEPKEGEIEGLLRELREETGIVPANVRKLVRKGEFTRECGRLCIIYKLKLDHNPIVSLSKEHTGYEWVKRKRLSSKDLADNVEHFINM